jgi:hypothetical protein
MRGAWKEMHFDRIFEAIATLADKLEISKKYLTTKTDFFTISMVQRHSA